MNKKLRVVVILAVFLLLGFLREELFPMLTGKLAYLYGGNMNLYTILAELLSFVVFVFVFPFITREGTYSQKLVASIKGNVVLYIGSMFLAPVITSFLYSNVIIVVLAELVITYFIYAVSMHLITQGKLKGFNINPKHLIFLIIGAVYYVGLICFMPGMGMGSLVVIGSISKIVDIIYWAIGVTMFFAYYEQKNEKLCE